MGMLCLINEDNVSYCGLHRSLKSTQFSLEVTDPQEEQCGANPSATICYRRTNSSLHLFASHLMERLSFAAHLQRKRLKDCKCYRKTKISSTKILL